MHEVVGYDRARIRAAFERRFSAIAMARRYEDLYGQHVPIEGDFLRRLA